MPLDWMSRQTALTAAVATATGTDRTVAQAVLELLGAFGPPYSLVYTPTVDAAKAAGDTTFATALAAWQTATSAKHVQADRACRYAETLAGAAGPALPFDSASPDAIVARIARAAALPAASAVTRLLEAHRSGLSAAYAARPELRYLPAYGSDAVLPMVYLSGIAGTLLTPPPRHSGHLSVREFEEFVMGPLLALADATLAALAFV